MNEPENPQGRPDAPEEPPAKDLSLTLLYGFIVLAMFAAIGFALLIVLPFYHHRR
jgi:hypothetical protein